MEKRLILAMFLIFLTTMVWYMTLTPNKPGDIESEPVLVEEPIKETEDAAPLAVDSPSSNAWDAPVETPKTEPTLATSSDSIFTAPTAFDQLSPDRDIVIDTELYTAVFSTKGAVLKSWTLKEFRGYQNGDRVERLPLIPDNVTSRNLAFRLPIDGQMVDFSQVIFESDQDDVYLSRSESNTDTLHFVARRGDQIVRVNYVLYDDKYSFGYDIDIQNVDLKDAVLEIQWNTGLNITEKDVKYDRQYIAGIGDQQGEVVDYSLKKIRKEDGLKVDESFRWVGVKTHYFAFIFSALNTDIRSVSFRASHEENKDDKAPMISAVWRLPAETLLFNNQDFELYFGPQEYDILLEYHRNWEGVVDFGWDWIEPISRFMLLIFTFIHGFIPDYGLVIIIFALLIKVIFYPLMQKQLKSMQAMQAVQPQMTALKEKHKDSPDKLNKEMIKLYQEHKINPVSGCLPLFIQMPVFIALYNVLRTTIYIRDVEFLWILDLSQNPEISVIGALLPLAMGGSMFLQQKMSSSSEPTQQQQMMMYMMPVMFTFFSFQWSTGLILYWFIQNLTTIAQQYFINKKKAAEGK